MFTGLVETVGTLRQLHRSSDSCRLTVDSDLPVDELTLGESISVNGICLTVVDFGAGFFTADLSPETLRRSTFEHLARGSRLNLERALRLGDRLGGHIVTGHIDGQGRVTRIEKASNAYFFRIDAAPELLRYIVAKGSVALDGISLTVNEVDSSGFSLAIIPHTLDRTNLHALRVGDSVNLETDILGKYVARLLGGSIPDSGKSRINLEFLANNGYL
ncbi:riboflavin synthase [Geoalkalibacter subterraneus]|uniref:Riboflavin synthase n=1 Tax=Geoalkalibacter subterraneus TaxID=483547 RepID=A0A0B5FE64_9BACT|nr:riboflavin synthase [Geoalkalibacter subterraneus]AJF06452.1 riboflavin synthase subunit alpha [Geoalkalibacter subterraneus]